MPYLETGWLCLALLVAVIIQIVGFYIFYRIYLEVIEDFLSDILLIKKHRDFYGNSHLGRRMREILIMYMITIPGMYKKLEIIPAWKIQKVPPGLRFVVKFNAYSMIVTGIAMALLYYFRLRD